MRRSSISATMKKERFDLVYRTLSPDCRIALADSKICADRARLGVRRYYAAFLLLSTICYQLSAISALAQLAPTRQAPRNEPLEKYDNPPAPPRKIETSPRMISQFGVFTSYQANVDATGQNIVGDAANECSISVDQTDDGINCNGGGVQFQRCTDGGVTWQAPISIPNSPIYGTLDVDTNGNLFVGGWSGGTTFQCVRSSNAQIGGQTPTFDQVIPVN